MPILKAPASANTSVITFCTNTFLNLSTLGGDHRGPLRTLTNTATDPGYSRFRCCQCGRRFSERTGTPFNRLEFPTDIVFQVVVFRLLFKLSLRDLVRMFLIRGYDFTY
jgi:transposase-like protein